MGEKHTFLVRSRGAQWSDVSDLMRIDTTYSIEGVNVGCAGWSRLFTQMVSRSAVVYWRIWNIRVGSPTLPGDNVYSSRVTRVLLTNLFSHPDLLISWLTLFCP